MSQKRRREVEGEVEGVVWMRAVGTPEERMRIEGSMDAEAYMETDMEAASDGRLSEAKRSRGSSSSLHSLEAFGVDLSLLDAKEAETGGVFSRSASAQDAPMECDLAAGAISTLEACSVDTLEGGDQTFHPLHRRVAMLCAAERIGALRMDGPRAAAHDHFLLHVARFRSRSARSRLPTSLREGEDRPELR